MARGSRIVVLSAALGCGPGLSPTGHGGSGSGGTTGTNTPQTDVEVSASGTTELDGTDLDGDSTETTSVDTGDVAACLGGEPVGSSMVSLDPTDDDPLFPIVDGEFVCLVASVDAIDTYWDARLECEDRTFRWRLTAEHGLLDRTWVGRTLTLAGDLAWAGIGWTGWYAIRDEDGTLVCAAGTEPTSVEQTDPFAVDWIDLEEACPYDTHSCLIAHDHLLTISSTSQGDFECFGGNGHVTPDFILQGSASYWVNPDPGPFGRCDLSDAPNGLTIQFSIVRRQAP